MNKKPPKKDLKFAVLAADTALFTLRDDKLFIRLARVHRPPYFTNTQGIPGGLLRPDETAKMSAERNLKEKAGINTGVYLEQLFTFSEINRDPRGRVVAVAYLALVPWEKLSTTERMDREGARWSEIGKLPKLAYDHNKVAAVALERLRSRIVYTTLIVKLMPAEFTLTELEKAYETVLGQGIDKRNFRKKIMKLKLVASIGRKRMGLKHRPAMLYRFRSNEVKPMEVL